MPAMTAKSLTRSTYAESSWKSLYYPDDDEMVSLIEDLSQRELYRLGVL